MLLQHIIELEEGDVPVKSRHSPMCPAKQAAVYAEADEVLRQGVIEESESAWNNPVTLVMKPGKNGLHLDARRVNKVTTKDTYPYQQCRPETFVLAIRAGGRESTDQSIYIPWKAIVSIRGDALWAL